jgi:hypothetical protein
LNERHILIDENTYEAEIKLRKQSSPVEEVISSRVKYIEKKMPQIKRDYTPMNNSSNLIIAESSN